jgi:hypothetical protein
MALRLSYCTVEETEEEGDYGTDVPCLYATCQTTGHKVGPIWGQGQRSVRRALATLSEQCSCGRYHVRTK